MKSEILSWLTQNYSDEKIADALPELISYVLEYKRQRCAKELQQSSDIIIYTDGGCFPNPGKKGGWAAIFEQDGKFTEMSGIVLSESEDPDKKDVSNILVEMTAVAEALSSIPQPANITIWTDLDHIIKGMVDWREKWINNNYMTSSGKPAAHSDLWKKIHRLQDFHKSVSVQWVKSHSGKMDHVSLMNKKVDELVKSTVLCK